MKQSDLVIAALAATALYVVLKPLKAFNLTSQGKNKYTLEGALNVIRLNRLWTAIKNLSGTRITSAYRSPEINAKVGGVKNSDHVKGLACDFVPPTKKLFWPTVYKLQKMAENGQLGNIRQFIAETYKNVIHLGYYEAGKTGATAYLEQYAKGKHRAIEPGKA